MQKEEISICWLRRDLRLDDNAALFHALQSEFPVLLLFIFDPNILSTLENKKDRRVAFIYEELCNIETRLRKYHSSLFVVHKNPLDAFRQLKNQYDIKAIFLNHDYEPYAILRDASIKDFSLTNGIQFYSFKDQVIFEKSEVIKSDNAPYEVFTAYANSWKAALRDNPVKEFPSEKLLLNLFKTNSFRFPSLHQIGFAEIKSQVVPLETNKNLILHYSETRDIPSIEGTSHLGVHLRFGTISIRILVNLARELNEVFLNELIWREFFMMLLYHFPHVEHHPFHKKYENIRWRNNEEEFEKWCHGETGFPLVDAGMRQLNETGWMHNRVRMITAGFLSKDLLIDWRWGEAYFAQKLMDYELSSNNGNCQWAAGCGCDAAPYFRIFNPNIQIRKFDPDYIYIKRWIKNYSENYLPPIVDHRIARLRALNTYKNALK
ncbi:MAG: cryptochrome/photolyase family protein [Ginsengibacter sp.]